MSETVQHVTHVDHADSVETAEHVGSTRPIVVAPAANRGPIERVMRQLSWLLIAGALLGFAIGVLALGHQVTKLTDQLSDARTALVKNQTDVLAKLNETDERTACAAQYDGQRQAAFQEELSAIAKVVVAGFSTAPAPSTDRATAINAALGLVTASITAYDAAVNASKDYLDSGSPLPCPFPKDVKTTPSG